MTWWSFLFDALDLHTPTGVLYINAIQDSSLTQAPIIMSIHLYRRLTADIPQFDSCRATHHYCRTLESVFGDETRGSAEETPVPLRGPGVLKHVTYRPRLCV